MALRTIDIADGFSSPSVPSEVSVTARIHDQSGVAYGPTNRLAVDIGSVSLTVSNEVEIKNDAGSPVPVNGTVAVSNFPATQPVIGTFYQATQPVSIASTVNVNTGFAQALTDTQLRATAVVVSGTFYQTTQPVSIAGTPNVNTGLVQALTDTQLRATPVPVSFSVGSTTGAISTAQKAVGTTAVRATVAGTALTSNKKRKFKPSASNSGRIWYGSSTVTISTGIEIVGVDTINLDADYSDYYLISDTIAQVVELLEVV